MQLQVCKSFLQITFLQTFASLEKFLDHLFYFILHVRALLGVLHVPPSAKLSAAKRYHWNDWSRFV